MHSFTANEASNAFSVTVAPLPPASSSPPFDLSWKAIGVGDYNGDGYADLAWQHQSDNLAEVQFLAGTEPIGGGMIANSPFDASWSVAATGDFNGDGFSDLVYRQSGNGLTEIQFLKGTANVSGGVIANNPFDASWSIIAAGNFNGDGKSDLVWQQPSGGQTQIMLLDGNNNAGGGAITSNPFDSSWKIVTSGDFTASGTDGLVWQQASSGQV